MKAKKGYIPSRATGKRGSTASRGILLSVLSGLMLTASFPPGNLEWMAFVALVPLLKGLENTNPSRAFKLGLVAGMTHYLTLIYWIVVVLGQYGDINMVLCLVPLILLCLYLSVFPGLFSWFTSALAGSRFAITLSAFAWVGLEYARAKIMTGFPWCLLGYTQYENLHLIQVADLCGVYGLSFMLVLINGVIFGLFLKGRAQTRSFLKWEVLIMVAAVGGTLAYGHLRLSENGTSGGTYRPIRTAIVQANVDQSLKWDPDYQSKTMEIYHRLTREAQGFNPLMIVWPETAVPFFFQDNLDFSPGLISLARESDAVLVLGSPAYRRVDGFREYYNRAYLITPDDGPIQYYDKVHLVPFGEYVPLKKALWFIDRLVPAAGDFHSGDKVAPLRYRDQSLGVLICFEAIFPELARAHARAGASILINLTNDAWFGMTSAPHQHLSMAVFRAVENRRPLVRAANTGISALIGPQGRILARSGLFNEEVLRVRVDVPEPSLTFYSRFGDLFALCLLIVTLVSLLYYLWRRQIAG
jgi:apolipoprotein N-acyltransferase